MKQIHVDQVWISFCFIPKSYFWHSIFRTVVMDQHWKSAMASVHKPTNILVRKIRENVLSDFALFTTFKLSQVWKHIGRYGINVKILDFKACCRDLGNFPSKVGGARDLTQQIKLIKTGDFQYK